MPVRMENNCDPDQPTVIQKLKSRAQRNRDFNRRQTFLEKKSVCAILPFYELEGQDLSNEIQNGADDQQGSKLTLKLRKAQELTDFGKEKCMFFVTRSWTFRQRI